MSVLTQLYALALAVVAAVRADPDLYAISSLILALAVESGAAQLDALLRKLRRQPGPWSTDELMTWVRKFTQGPLGKALAPVLVAYAVARFLGHDPVTTALALHATAVVCVGFSLGIWRDARVWTIRFLLDLAHGLLGEPFEQLPA